MSEAADSSIGGINIKISFNKLIIYSPLFIEFSFNSLQFALLFRLFVKNKQKKKSTPHDETHNDH